VTARAPGSSGDPAARFSLDELVDVLDRLYRTLLA
jgi:hypothetical protein